MTMTAESFDSSPTPPVGLPAPAERTPGRHRDPTEGFAAPTSLVEQRTRLDRRRIHAVAVAVLAGTMIMVFAVADLFQHDHQGTLGLLATMGVGLAVVAVATLVLVLDPPRKNLVTRRHLKGRRARRH